MSSGGAKSAYRGYRLQALYVLFRIFKSGTSRRLIFQPEGHEDLAIFDEAGDLSEAIQVKAHTRALTVSTFSPEKSNSFFRRAIELSRTYPQAAIKIVSFGPISPKMARAWEADGEERRAITRKLLDSGYSPDDIDTLLRSVQLVKVDENSLRNEVFTFLRETLVGGDPEHAFDLLIHFQHSIFGMVRKHKQAL